MPGAIGGNQRSVLFRVPEAVGDELFSIHMKERRSIGRTRVAKGALLFFSGQVGVRSCGVTDITNRGAGIRTRDLAVLPLNFDLSFDNFRTIRRCRLVWRDGDFLGAAFI
jgi:hypothetical protein